MGASAQVGGSVRREGRGGIQRQQQALECFEHV